MNAKEVWSVLKQVGAEYVDDKIPKLSAALAFYTMLSLAPMLVISIVILGLVFGEQAASGKVAAQLEQVVGPASAGAINDMIANAKTPGSGWMATIISLIVLLFGASGVFAELQDSMNTIFDVRRKSTAGIWQTIRGRLVSMGMVFGVAFLLLVSLVISTTLSAVASAIAGGWAALGYVLDLVISVVVVGMLFAAIFKVLPDVKIGWKDTVVGALVTAVLFTLGKIGLGIYLSYGSTASAYGAAGSLAALLIWIYYSSQIMFIGAEFTQVYANRYGKHVEPVRHAERVGRKSTGGGSSRSQPAISARAAAVAPSGQPPTGVHHARQAVMYGMPPSVNGAPPAAIGAMAVGAVVGGLGTLIGLKIQRYLRDTEAPRLNDRIAAVENRIQSLKRLRADCEEDCITDRLRKIEQRILTAARAGDRVHPMPLKDRIAAILRDKLR